MKRNFLITLCTMLTLGTYLLSCKSSVTVSSATTQTQSNGRDRRWARPLQIDGLPNFHKVADGLYRGAQPNAEGMRALQRLGVRTVVNLRSFHSDREALAGVDLAYEHIYMKSWHPEDKEVVRFLQIVNKPERQPVFVHCMHGADRTGTMCAIYRIVIEGWTKEDALQEMQNGGFNFHGGWWPNLVTYIQELDVDSLKRRAGIEK